jgi:proline iminopeptidase
VLAPHRDRIEELRAQGNDREVAIVQWSAEFGDGRERERAEDMATPWFGINQDCYTQIWAELERALPQVTRVILPDAGHIPWLERPEEFARSLLAFLEQAIHP